MSDNNRPTLITPPAIISWPRLFKPEAFEEGKPEKYSCTLIFTEETQQTPEYQELRKAAVNAGVEFFGEARFRELLQQGVIDLPFRDYWARKKYPENSVHINLKSDYAPGVVSRYQDPATGKARVITNPEEVYPGAIVKAIVSPYAYDNKTKGVGFGLEHIQLWADGERMGFTRAAAEDAFSAEPPAEVDLSDVGAEAAAATAPAATGAAGLLDLMP